MRCPYCGQFRQTEPGSHLCPVGGEVVYAPPDPLWWIIKRNLRRILRILKSIICLGGE